MPVDLMRTEVTLPTVPRYTHRKLRLLLHHSEMQNFKSKCVLQKN